MIVGNLVGGRLADRALVPALLGTLATLAIVLFAMTFALRSQVLAIVSVGLLGAAAFATVSPLQMRVLQKADGAGQSLASSFNIAAFNLGNALGAWLGSVVIARGPGLGALSGIAALLARSSRLRSPRSVSRSIAERAESRARRHPSNLIRCFAKGESHGYRYLGRSGLSRPGAFVRRRYVRWPGQIVRRVGQYRRRRRAPPDRPLPRRRRQPVRHGRHLFERRIGVDPRRRDQGQARQGADLDEGDIPQR